MRRVYVTLAALLVTALAAAAAVAYVYRARRPAEYVPGEENSEITRSLAQQIPADAPKPRFTDVTREAGLDGFRSFAGTRTSQLPEDMGAGAAWGDFNNDGFQDLLLVAGGGPLGAPTEKLAPTQLYENLGNGRFRLVSDFESPRIHGMGAAWGDADGDGWIDLVITGYNTILFYHNDHGHLVRDTRFPSPPGFWASAQWGDFDNDGNLDLYICGYVKYAEPTPGQARASDQYGVSVPYTLNPASFEPERNLLFHNNGNGTFTEVAHKLGVDNPEGRSLSAIWHDVDNDGWLDLYVANDISDNVLYHNVHGRFEDISHPAWVADYRGAMGLAAGDWDRDGDDDLFITHWIAQENALYNSLLHDQAAPKPARDGSRQSPVLSPQSRVPASAPLSKAAPPPPLRFVDAADSVGLGQIALPMVGWGTEFADFDGDGWLDLAVANGSTIEAEGPPPKKLNPQLPFLFWNRHGEHFFDLAPLVPALAQPRVARGLAVADYDNDGDQDLLITTNDGGVLLLRNDMQRGHWLELSLRSRTRHGAPLGRGVGAQVTAEAGGARLRRTVGGGSYLSQSSPIVHVGLGAATRVDRVEVTWRAGSTTVVGPLDADRAYEIREGDTTPTLLSPTKNPANAGGPPNLAAEREFWAKQRDAMHALKVEKDLPKAAALLREALVLNPSHEDSRYYLGNALAALGDVDGALAQFDLLIEQDPQSHRAYARWGTLRAQTSRSAGDLAAAEQSLERAHRLNPEETGALLALGEVALMRGNRAQAAERLTAACATNSRSAAGLFLLGYVRWKAGDAAAARELLERSRAALGPDWKPKGATAEGDVAQKAHTETTPLAPFLERWNGQAAPAAAYGPLDRFLRGGAGSSVSGHGAPTGGGA